MFGNDEDLDWYTLYQYDNNQQLSKAIVYYANPVQKTNEWHFKFNAQNNLVSIKRHYMSMGNPVLGDSASFVYTDKTLPAHWQLYEEFMYEFPIDKTLVCMLATSFFHHNIAVGLSQSTHTFTQKNYNSQGYLTSQQYKLEAKNGLETTTTNYNLKYQYIE